MATAFHFGTHVSCFLVIFLCLSFHYYFSGEWHRKDQLIKEIPSTGLSVGHYGSGVVADFDGDGLIDILVPICRDAACHIVDIIMIYSPRNGWVYFQLDLKDSELIPGDDGTVFRVGDFTLDGYPDLIATIIKSGKIMPMVFENVDYNGNLNFSRLVVGFLYAKLL